MCVGVSADHKTASILVSNFADLPCRRSIRLQNLPGSRPSQAEAFAVDATHKLQPIDRTAWKGEDARLTLDMSGGAVYLVRLCTTLEK